MKILLIPDKEDNWSAHNRTLRLQERLTNAVIIGGNRLAQVPLDELLTFDVIHFNYSSYIGEHRGLVEALLASSPRPVLIGSAIGHRWHAGSDDCEKRAHTLETLAVMRMLDHVYAQTPELERRLIANGITHVTTIPNGVSRALFPYRRELLVGHVGPRFERPVGDYKGGDLAAEACRALGFAFTVPGCYGENRGPQVPGQRPQTDMVSWYRSIDVLCQPSAGEGCSNPIMEALAMNIRVVCTREAITESLRPYVTLCTRSVEDIMEKLDTSALVPDWDDVAARFGRLYERVARAAGKRVC